MILKNFLENGERTVAQVTFTLPNCFWCESVHLVGDFNRWNRRSHPFHRDREGRWTITIELEIGRAYQFRYLLDANEWTNDNQADAYVHNPYGSDNFIVVTDPTFKQYRDEPLAQSSKATT